MLKQLGFWAAIEVARDSGIYVRMTAGTREALIVLAATLPVIVLILFWALVLRKPSRRHRQHDETPATLIRYRHKPQEGSGLLTFFRSDHRRRKRAHRRRNPTLADTGGLPPARTDESLSSPVPPPPGH